MTKAGLTLVVCLMTHVIHAQRFVPSVSKYISDSAEIIAFKDVKIIDGTGNPSMEHQSIIISKGRIVKVMNGGTLPEKFRIKTDIKIDVSCLSG